MWRHCTGTRPPSLIIYVPLAGEEERAQLNEWEELFSSCTTSSSSFTMSEGTLRTRSLGSDLCPVDLCAPCTPSSRIPLLSHGTPRFHWGDANSSSDDSGDEGELDEEGGLNENASWDDVFAG